jgi:hypothetical protein
VARKEPISIPKAMQIQIARLFGANSKEAKKDQLSQSQCKKILKKMLDEISRYLEDNVETDELHLLMLYSGLWAASESLNEEEYLLGYIEGIVRFSLLLMGDYPDHRKRMGGRKSDSHYDLKQMRSIIYAQDSKQKLQTMIAASMVELPEFKKNAYVALREFRQEVGYKASYKEFLRWFRKKYPEDYASLF